MYDIYFDLNNMHQVVVEDETSFEIELDEELISFNFELDLPEALEPADDFAVVVRKKPSKSSNGYTCSHCGEIYPYAEEPNQKDGSFKCYSCRKYG